MPSAAAELCIVLLPSDDKVTSGWKKARGRFSKRWAHWWKR